MAIFSIKHFHGMLNDIVLADSHTVGRFVGFHEDMMDYYYIIHRIGPQREYYLSCVGGITSLRVLEHYDYYDSCHTLNGCPPVPKMIMVRQTKEYQNEGYFQSECGA